MTNLRKVLLVEDHKAILDHILSNAATIFPEAEITVISEPAAATNLSGDFQMGLIDPGLPGIPHDDIPARIAFAGPLLERITEPDKRAVFTGIATPKERARFAAAGFPHYLSKSDTGLTELQTFFAKGHLCAAAPPPQQRIWSFLNATEKEALALKDQHPELSYAQLAALAGRSEGAFQQAIKRARRKIRERE